MHPPERGGLQFFSERAKSRHRIGVCRSVPSTTTWLGLAANRLPNLASPRLLEHARQVGPLANRLVQLLDFLVGETRVDIAPLWECSFIRAGTGLLVREVHYLDDELLVFAKRVTDELLRSGAVISSQVTDMVDDGFHGPSIPPCSIVVAH